MRETVKTLVIPIAGLVLMAVPAYIMLRTSGGRVVIEIVCGLLMVSSFCLMGWSVFRTVGAQRRAKQLQERMSAKLAEEFERGEKSEQERMNLQREYARQITTPIARKEPELTLVQLQFRNKVQADIGKLTWAQKLALRQICEFPGYYTEFSLLMYLREVLGFEDPFPAKIIHPLLRVGLVKKSGEILEPDAGKIDEIGQLFGESPLLQTGPELSKRNGCHPRGQSHLNKPPVR